MAGTLNGVIINEPEAISGGYLDKITLLDYKSPDSRRFLRINCAQKKKNTRIRNYRVPSPYLNLRIHEHSKSE